MKRRPSGFTLIELLVVLAIVALLLSVVAPRYIHSVDHAKDAVLKEDLATLRDAIDKYYGDHGTYPASLALLAEQRYVRAVPADPLTQRNDSWVAVPAPPPLQGVMDVHSGAAGDGADGTAYASW